MTGWKILTVGWLLEDYAPCGKLLCEMMIFGLKILKKGQRRTY